MLKSTCAFTLLFSVVSGLAGCELEPVDPNLTGAEGELIYNQMVQRVSEELTVSQQGAIDETIDCPVGGSWRLQGEVLNSGSDRGWDLDTTAQGCGIAAYLADGSRVDLTLDGGPVAVFSPPAGDDTPFSSSGTVNWSTPDGRSGSCAIFDSPGEGLPGGCD